MNSLLFIASKSQIKIDACSELVGPYKELTNYIPCTDTCVDNPNQPYGIMNTIICAMRRIIGVYDNVHNDMHKNDKIIAIENGIATKDEYLKYCINKYAYYEEDEDMPEVFDFVCVIKFTNIPYIHGENEYMRYFTINITRPKYVVTVDDIDLLEVVKKSPFKNGGYEITYGSLMSNKYDDISSTNWMLKYGIDRVKQIKSTINKGIVPDVDLEIIFFVIYYRSFAIVIKIKKRTIIK
jgi:hypothetical protein